MFTSSKKLKHAGEKRSFSFHSLKQKDTLTNIEKQLLNSDYERRKSYINPFKDILKNIE